MVSVNGAVHAGQEAGSSVAYRKVARLCQFQCQLADGFLLVQDLGVRHGVFKRFAHLVHKGSHNLLGGLLANVSVHAHISVLSGIFHGHD